MTRTISPRVLDVVILSVFPNKFDDYREANSDDRNIVGYLLEELTEVVV